MHHGNCIFGVYKTPSPNTVRKSFRMKNTIDTTQRVCHPPPHQKIIRTSHNSMAAYNRRKLSTHTKFIFIFLHDDWVLSVVHFCINKFHQNKEEKLLRLMSQMWNYRHSQLWNSAATFVRAFRWAEASTKSMEIHSWCWKWAFGRWPIEGDTWRSQSIKWNLYSRICWRKW